MHPTAPPVTEVPGPGVRIGFPVRGGDRNRRRGRQNGSVGATTSWAAVPGHRQACTRTRPASSPGSAGVGCTVDPDGWTWGAEAAAGVESRSRRPGHLRRQRRPGPFRCCRRSWSVGSGRTWRWAVGHAEMAEASGALVVDLPVEGRGDRRAARRRRTTGAALGEGSVAPASTACGAGRATSPSTGDRRGGGSPTVRDRVRSVVDAVTTVVEDRRAWMWCWSILHAPSRSRPSVADRARRRRRAVRSGRHRASEARSGWPRRWRRWSSSPAGDRGVAGDRIEALTVDALGGQDPTHRRRDLVGDATRRSIASTSRAWTSRTTAAETMAMSAPAVIAFSAASACVSVPGDGSHAQRVGAMTRPLNPSVPQFCGSPVIAAEERLAGSPSWWAGDLGVGDHDRGHARGDGGAERDQVPGSAARRCCRGEVSLACGSADPPPIPASA